MDLPNDADGGGDEGSAMSVPAAPMPGGNLPNRLDGGKRRILAATPYADSRLIRWLSVNDCSAPLANVPPDRPAIYDSALFVVPR